MEEKRKGKCPKMVNFNFGLVHRLNRKIMTCFETQINLYHFVDDKNQYLSF